MGYPEDIGSDSYFMLEEYLENLAGGESVGFSKGRRGKVSSQLKENIIS